MCGIAGVVLEKRKRSERELNEIRAAFTTAFLANQKRGADAAGVAVIARSGGTLVAKQPGPAFAFINSKEYSLALNAIDKDTAAVFGHARKATRGRPSDNRNNQPVDIGAVVGIHNGTIENADWLFKKYGLKRAAEVDSEVIFRIAARATDAANFRAMISPARGTMAAAFVKRDEPGRVYLLKANKPLAVFWVPEWRAVFFSSTEEPLLKALGHLDYKRIEMKPFTMMTFDTNERVSKTRLAEFTIHPPREKVRARVNTPTAAWLPFRTGKGGRLEWI